MSHTRIALLGFGTVGQAFLSLLLEKTVELRPRYAIEWSLVGVFGRRLGAAIDEAGIDPSRALELARSRRSLAPLGAAPFSGDGVAFARAVPADILFENTPVNYGTGEPAVSHLRAALEAGMHAITANKGPVVHAYRELTALARAKGRHFLYESAVMDGAPIFSLWRTALPGARVLGFRGVLNSTTNLILTLMETGHSFDEAVAQAQAIGIAETDPSGDILGWDAVVKVAALSTVLLETPLTPQRVPRQGIERIGPQDITTAKESGRRWKLICRAQHKPNGVEARVAPELLGPEDPLFAVMGTSSSITFESDVLGKLTITEENPGPATTAYGLLADMIHALKTPTS
jgi:homoserine dehydrogenase